MYLRSILAAGLLALGTAGAVFAEGATGGDPAHRMHPHMMAGSVEHVAIHNIMAQLLADKTGRSVDDIRALFEGSDPHDAIAKLGLSRDDMHALMEQAHDTYVTKATAAGLITADQAQKIRAAHAEHFGPPPGQ
jgi:hypothetical protein